MTRALTGTALALVFGALVPSTMPAQRGSARPAPPAVIVRPPANPPVIGIVPGAAQAPRTGGATGRYRGGWTPGSGIGIVPGTPVRPAPRNGHVPIVMPVRPRSRLIGPFVPRSGLHRGCLGVCGCFGSWLCTPTVVFGLPYLPVPYGVPVEVPTEPLSYVVEPPVYAAEPAATPMPRDTSFAHSKLIIVGGESGRGGDALTIEQMGDTVLRLTWLGSIRPIREARVFVADSAQRTLRSQRVDAATPSALFETKELRRRIAYAGVSVTFTDGVMSTTVMPVRLSAPGTPPPKPPPSR